MAESQNKQPQETEFENEDLLELEQELEAARQQNLKPKAQKEDDIDQNETTSDENAATADGEDEDEETNDENVTNVDSDTPTEENNNDLRAPSSQDSQEVPLKEKEEEWVPPLSEAPESQNLNDSAQAEPETQSSPIRAPSSIEENKVVLKKPPMGETPQDWAFTATGGIYRPNSYLGSGTAFNRIFRNDGGVLGNKGFWADLSLEWQILQGPFGKLGPKFTTGSWVIQRLFDPTTDTDTVEKRYTLWALPVFLGGIYRLHFWKKQPLIPFMEVAGGAIHFMQGDQAIALDRYHNIWRVNYFYGGGLQLNLNLIDPTAGKSFDVNWGVNATYLTAQWRTIQSKVADEFDFSGDELITAGLSFEF